MKSETVFSNDLALESPNFFTESLAHSVKHILSSRLSQSHFNQEIESLYQRKLGDRRLILHPELFYWMQVYKDESTLDKSKFEELKAVINHVNESHESMIKSKSTLGLYIDLNPFNHLFSADRLVRAEKAAEGAGSEKISFSLVPCDYTLLENSLELMASCCPSLLSELEKFVTHIYFFEGKSVIGFTDFQNHGSIFLKYQLFKDNPIRLAEELIHEAGHTILNTVMVKDKLILNKKEERFSTPLRRDPRPMFGLFHQLYVLSKLNIFYRSILSKHVNEAREKLQKIVPQLDLALKVVKHSAAFTSMGEQIFNELESKFLTLGTL